MAVGNSSSTTNSHPARPFRQRRRRRRRRRFRSPPQRSPLCIEYAVIVTSCLRLHTHTHTLHHLCSCCSPLSRLSFSLHTLSSHTSSLRALRLRLALRWRWRLPSSGKLFTYRFVCNCVRACVCVCLCFCISFLSLCAIFICPSFGLLLFFFGTVVFCGVK